MKRAWLAGVAVAVVMVITAAGPVGAGDALRVVEITSKKVSLFGGPTGKKVARVPRDDISTPTEVLDVSPNGRLLIEHDGKELWVNGHQVRTNHVIDFKSGCVKTQDYAAVRGMGNCE